jgi:hypothetical protein
MDGGVGHNKGGKERQYSTFDLWDVLTCDVPRWSPKGHKRFLRYQSKRGFRD